MVAQYGISAFRWFGRASVQVGMAAELEDYLPWGLYQISKYIKNDISHVSHWQAEVSPEKIKA